MGFSLSAMEWTHYGSDVGHGIGPIELIALGWGIEALPRIWTSMIACTCPEGESEMARRRNHAPGVKAKVAPAALSGRKNVLK